MEPGKNQKYCTSVSINGGSYLIPSARSFGNQSLLLLVYGISDRHAIQPGDEIRGALLLRHNTVKGFSD